MSYRHFCKTSWKRMTKTNILVLIKTSSEDVWLRRIYSSWSRHLEDVIWRRRQKASSRRVHQDECLLENAVLPLYIWKKSSKKLEKHLWRGLFCKTCGITYHSLPKVKFNKRTWLETWRTCCLHHQKIKKALTTIMKANLRFKLPLNYENNQLNNKKTPKVSNNLY